MANVDSEYGLAQWTSYPQWVRGPARVTIDEVVLDEDRAEPYGIHERADYSIFMELAELTAGPGMPHARNIGSFVGRNGLLWHGADSIGTGECREPLQEWLIESRIMGMLLKVYAAFKDSMREGSASALREVLRRIPEVSQLVPSDANDQELLMETSANLAEMVTLKLEGCQLGLTSSVYLDERTSEQGPGIFLLLQRPPHLLSAAYAHLAQFMVDRKPLEECPGCRRIFIPRSGRQKYCRKSCANTNRWHRWKANQDSN